MFIKNEHADRMGFPSHEKNGSVYIRWRDLNYLLDKVLLQN